MVLSLHRRLRVTADLYDPPPGAPPAVVVVLDGALEPSTGWDEPGRSRLRAAVTTALSAFYLGSQEIVLISTLPVVCRDLIEEHLAGAHVRYDRLLMSAESGPLTRLDLFNAHIRDAYDVTVVLDTEPRSVDAWRSMGLTCFQVSPGAR